MRTIFLFATLLLCFSVMGNDGALAAKRATKDKMQLRCDLKFIACDEGCEKDKNTTPSQYKKCQEGCKRNHNKCLKRVDEINRQSLPGGDDGSGGGVLSPE